MEGTELENVLCFTYLGSNFEADGDCEQDVKIRMAIAKSTFGKLMEIWKAEEISLKQKLRLYSAASRHGRCHRSWKTHLEVGMPGA